MILFESSHMDVDHSNCGGCSWAILIIVTQKNGKPSAKPEPHGDIGRLRNEFAENAIDFFKGCACQKISISYRIDEVST